MIYFATLFIFISSMICAMEQFEMSAPREKTLVFKMIDVACLEQNASKDGDEKKIESLIFAQEKIQDLEQFINSKHKRFTFDLLVKIPRFHDLSNIVNLNLSGNQLTDLPETLKELKHIESFDGSNNKFRWIPGVAKYWQPTLNELDVADNQIESVERIGDEPLSNFKKLQWINIAGNCLKELPCEEIYELYCEQQEKRQFFWVCVHEDYLLDERLTKVQDKVFLHTARESMQLEY